MWNPRPLGKSGLTVSPLGYGAFKLGRNQQHHFSSNYELPSEAEATRLLNTVLDAGITLIDTAPAYGLSEERIGRAIGHRRDEFVLMTKVGEQFANGRSSFDFSCQAVTASLERSLSRLQTDHVEVLFVHSSGDDLAILHQTDIVETLQKSREQGLTKAIGFSGKTVEGAEAAMDWADVLMVTFNESDTSHQALIEEASNKGVGIVVKKGFASGRLTPDSAIPFVLNQSGVDCLLIDTLCENHLQENVAIAESSLGS